MEGRTVFGSVHNSARKKRIALAFKSTRAGMRKQGCQGLEIETLLGRIKFKPGRSEDKRLGAPVASLRKGPQRQTGQALGMGLQFNVGHGTSSRKLSVGQPIGRGLASQAVLSAPSDVSGGICGVERGAEQMI